MCWRSVRPPADRRCAFPAPPPFPQAPATFRRYNPAFPKEYAPVCQSTAHQGRTWPFPVPVRVRLGSGVVDELEHCVGEGQGTHRSPLDAALCQHVVVAADAHAVAAVLLIGKLARKKKKRPTSDCSKLKVAITLSSARMAVSTVRSIWASSSTRQITERTRLASCRPQTHLGVCAVTTNCVSFSVFTSVLMCSIGAMFCAISVQRLEQ